MDFPIYDYPTNAATDPNVLYAGLGSFWTNIFRDKATLKGLTTGLAEELIQRYYDLVEVINSYAVDDVPVFHKEKWKPLVMYKSKLNRAPLVFNSDDAIFGPQTASDTYYADVTFEFGFQKRPSAQVYTYAIGDDLKDFGVITDRIFDPAVVYTNGADVYVGSDGVLHFNKNFFEDSNITTTTLIDDNGDPVVYTDEDGQEQEEQFVVLWAYHAQVDNKILYNSFGYIFSLNLTNDSFFKELLKSIFKLYINGPTVANVIAIASAFINVKAVVSDGEEVVDIFSDSLNKFVITDKNVYKFDILHNIKSSIVVGSILNGGDSLIDGIEYYDNVSTPGWWKSTSILRSRLALSQYLFLGNYESQLVIPNTLDVITLNSLGDIVFPVYGTEADVALFHTQLNANKAAIKTVFGLVNPGDSIPFIPVDFIMENFLKQNTVLVKFRFGSQEEQASFLNLLPVLRKQLPPYVYVIFDLEMVIDTEEYSNLNDCCELVYDAGTVTVSSDGSDDDGIITPYAPYYYKSAKLRFFEISRGLPEFRDYVGTPSALAEPAYTTPILEGRTMTVRDGTVFREPSPGDSTAQVNKIQLIGFV